jgi:hypothetical protein
MGRYQHSYHANECVHEALSLIMAQAEPHRRRCWLERRQLFGHYCSISFDSKSLSADVTGQFSLDLCKYVAIHVCKIRNTKGDPEETRD